MRDLKSIYTIAFYTQQEIVKSKVMLATFILTVALALTSFVAAEFSYGVPGKVALDFGLGVSSVSCVGLAIFMGAGLIANEIETRTIYMILTRPIRRHSFLIGKFLGMSFIMFVNILMLGGMAIFIYKLYGGIVDPLMFWCLLFIFLESIIVLSFVIFFSLITNTALTIIYSICMFIFGHAIGSLDQIGFVKANKLLSGTVGFLSYLIPDLGRVNLKDYVVYKQSIPVSVLGSQVSYVLAYTLVIMFVSCKIFDKKNLD